MATNDKYDRQLRLWGAKGQQALGETHVVLVGASAAGTETLKNLVLPGVGSFCVMDPNYCKAGTPETVGDSFIGPSIVTKHDASSNFFLPSSAVGRPRAEVASQYLRELNQDVQGSFLSLEAAAILASSPSEWARVLQAEQTAHPGMTVLVVASDLEPPALDALAGSCIAEALPLIVVQSYGLIGTVRLQLPGTVPLLDPKPTNAPPDLRLRTAFPGLVRMADQIHLADLDSQQHSHVPYPILLYKAAQQYRTTHNGKWPQTFAEKEDFKATIKALSRDLDKEVNFEEAIANAYLAYTERDIVWPVDDDDAAMDGSDQSAPKNSTTLGRLYAALQSFMELHDGRPPVNGSIPDMTASTDVYVQLQRVYKEQAEQDVQEMTRLVQQQEEQAVGGLASVTTDQIADFCANVYNVGHMKTRSLKQEYYGDDSSAGPTTPDSDLVDDWKTALMDPYEDGPIHTPLLWYLGLRACQLFFHQQGRYPGTLGISTTSTTTGDEKKVDEGAEWKMDIPVLTKIMQEAILVQYQLVDQQGSLLSAGNCEMICEELTRYANAEIHTVASVVGGVASQEAVKIITGQYVPLDNTYVYNGIVSVSGVYKM